MCKKITYLKHVRICPYTVPPGTKVYDDCKLDCPPTFSNCTSLSIYEIDGKDSKLYCQNLCLLSKLFLDHKTLYFDVTPFVFYVLTENEANGRAHVVGYFSKDKKMNNNCNLSCILILPPFQKKGYGKLLIAFSYYLSRKTDQLCGPEKPLSDMGKLSYISYWKELIFEVLKDCKPPKTPPSLRELSRITRLKEDDIKIALGTLKMIKYWKSEYIIEADIIKEINSYFKSKEDDAKRPDQRKAVFKADSIMLK
jgi:histone acetyltransferase MYST1